MTHETVNSEAALRPPFGRVHVVLWRVHGRSVGYASLCQSLESLERVVDEHPVFVVLLAVFVRRCHCEWVNEREIIIDNPYQNTIEQGFPNGGPRGKCTL